MKTPDLNMKTPDSNIKTQESKIKEVDDKEKIMKLFEKKKLEKEIKAKESELEKTDEYKTMMQEKIDLNSKINELKLEKKKLLEAQISYNNDVKLYDFFTKEKEKNVTFIIPELFTLKFDIFNRLTNNNSLTFENFKDEYDKLKPKNDYDDVFKINSYEESFVKNKKSDFEMDFSIEL
jgi:hypothetical protein